MSKPKAICELDLELARWRVEKLDTEIASLARRLKEVRKERTTENGKLRVIKLKLDARK